MAYRKRTRSRSASTYSRRRKSSTRSRRSYSARKPRRALKRVRGGSRATRQTIRLEIVTQPSVNPIEGALNAQRETVAPKKAKF